MRNAAWTALLFVACSAAVTPSAPPLLAIDLQGQIVGSSARELIVQLKNEAPVEETIVLEVEVPSDLLLPSGLITGSMQQVGTRRTETASILRFREERVSESRQVIVRIPIANRMGEIEVRAWTERDPQRQFVERRNLILTR